MVDAAPACKAVLAQATTQWPARNRASDGILSSDAHKLQNPSSDHDYGNAVDLTHDPANGCDAHGWVRALVRRGDRRVKLAISNREIWSAARAAEGWRPYSGSNAHTLHAHVSIYSDYRNDTSPWFSKTTTTTATTASTAPTAPEDFDMDKAELAAMMRDSESRIMTAVRKELADAIQAITGGVRTRDAEGNVIDNTPGNISLADVYTQDEKRH